MQAVDQDKIRLAIPKDEAGPQPSAIPPSWFSIFEAHADRAARAGFLISMMFLTAAAFYGLVLSGTAAEISREVSTTADRAAYDAGFRVEDLTISGAENTPHEALMKALALPFADSSLLYDAAAAQDRLMQIGWVASAEVRRILPSRLEVILKEREPFARWADADNVVQAIDREGNVLGPANGKFEMLLLLAGEGAPAEVAELSDALSAHEAIRQRIERIELVAGRFWQVNLDNGLTLKLPRKVTDLVLGKAEALLASNKIAELALSTIDLRLANRTILQLREPTLANRDRAVAIITSGSGQQPASPPKRGRAL